MPWLFKFKGKSDVWWVGYRVNGEQILRSTGYRERNKAEQELQRVNATIAAQKAGALTRELYERLTAKAIPNVSLKAAISDWLNEAAGATAKRTVEKYKLLGDDLITFFNANDQGPKISEITREDLQRYLGARRATVAASTANMARKCLAILFASSAKSMGDFRFGKSPQVVI